MSAISLVTVLSLCVLPLIAAETCQSNPYINGCSLPFHMPFFYKQKFTPSCNLHDMCYKCVIHFGKTKADCDSEFYQNMKTACNSLSKRFLLPDHAACKASALTFYESVKGFGALFFQTTSPSWCAESWTRTCVV
ncbi:Hypothetical predicted protein [Mytilus galloprovincialis]|uniref:Conodipine-M alpha chain n=1 Tax=Mytilus galloprovincialis TaxID=29158 RepID=A0A8B6D459_MYTGA|nr:Hypothetical predicted protein [Mytilus galloprovincialis]